MTQAVPFSTFDIGKEDVDAIKKDLISLRDDVAKLFNEIGERGRDDVSTLKQEVRETVSHAKNTGLDWGNGQAKTLQNYVREQPFQSCAIAVGLGAVIGALILKR